MKRYGNLWEKVISWENLVLAARRAQRGKRGRFEVQQFNFMQEMRLIRLQEELTEGSYQPGGFRSHWISKPKPRLISAAPYRDRVVHHALMNVLEPILERHFHPDSYACRKGKGTHAAANRLQAFMHRYRYALQVDIQKFFASIDHELLKGRFRRLIKDPATLKLMDLIVDTSNEQPGAITWFAGDDLFTPIQRRRGLPIGNLTSQWFANWYLSGLDHLVTSHLGIGGYVRYCDDFILLHNDKKLLREAQGVLGEHLTINRLRLHERKTFIRPVRAGINFVGYRIWPNHRLLRKQNVRNFRRRIGWMKKAYAQGLIDADYITPRLASWLGYAAQADTKKLIRSLSRQWRFERERADNEPCYSRRQLEQQRDQLPRHQPQQQHADQSQQQHRISFSPALSHNQTRKRSVQGSGARGTESPGSLPAPNGGYVSAVGQIDRVEPGGSGRSISDVPARFPILTVNRRYCA